MDWDFSLTFQQIINDIQCIVKYVCFQDPFEANVQIQMTWQMTKTVTCNVVMAANGNILQNGECPNSSGQASN